MWIEDLPNGNFKFIDRYLNPYTEKYRKVSITLNSKSNRAKNEAQRILQAKIDNILSTPIKSELTFKELKGEWFLFYKNTVKNSSSFKVQFVDKLVSNYIEDDYLAKNIDSPIIQKMLNDLYYEKNYSLNYVKQVRTTINLVFKYALRMKYIKENPVESTTVTRKPKTFEEIENIANKYLEKEEIKAIINQQRNTHNGKRNADLTEFLSLTGLRIGEAIALLEEDFKGSFILVKGTIDYTSNKYSDAVKTTTKNTKSTRRVDLPDRAIKILEKVIFENSILAQRKNYNQRFYIFTSVYGNPIGVGVLNNSLATAAKHLGINKRVSSHIMRHTHISLLAEFLIPLKAIMDRVGHEDADTTIKIYTHVTKDMKTAVIEKLNTIEF